jgi:Flp pilus assembly protein TadG
VAEPAPRRRVTGTPGRRPGAWRRKREKGASAIEFALVFPFFFGLLYAIISYGLLFGLQHSITAAAKEAARSGVACDPTFSTAEHEACVVARARATATEALGWLPEGLRDRVLGTNGASVGVSFTQDPTAGKSVEILVQLPSYAADPILPTVALPLIGSVPVLPERLAARAVVGL